MKLCAADSHLSRSLINSPCLDIYVGIDTKKGKTITAKVREKEERFQLFTDEILNSPQQ